MSFEQELGWLTYIVGLAWYLCVCFLVASTVGGHWPIYATIMASGFIGWTVACLLARKYL